MSSRLFKNLLRLSAHLLPIFILGCNTGSNSSSSSVNQGQLQLSGRDSQMALGGTHEYIVSLVGSQNLPAPVSINVSSSNSGVLSVESNTCATQALYTNITNVVPSCSFYVRGKSLGSATISVASSNYPIMQESVTVAKQWGTFGSEITDQEGDSIVTSTLSFGGDKVYTNDGYGDVFSTTGDGWQLIGGGTVTTEDFKYFYNLISDDTHVCMSVEKLLGQSFIYKIRCSTNNGDWQDLPSFGSGISIGGMSLYKGNLYVLNSVQYTSIYYVESCPIDNCINWQRRGEQITTHFPFGGIVFESTPYILDDNSNLYYQTNSGEWQVYGQYLCPPNVGCFIQASESGVAIFPEIIEQTPFSQSIYYNRSNDIGGVFTSIGESIGINNFFEIDFNPLSMTNNNIYLTPGDGNVYVSNNDNNEWSQWEMVGTNNPLLANVYYHDNKLYSVALQNNKSQIYIYPIDN